METIRVPMQELAELLKLQLEQGGRAELTVTGSSMMPMLQGRRDKVILVPGQAKKNDVALYRRDDGKYILHRIVGQQGDMLVCAGDNQWETELIRPDQVMAVVDSWYYKGKHKTKDGLGYKLYVGFWVGLLPVRRPILAVRRVVGRLIRKIKRRKSHA